MSANTKIEWAHHTFNGWWGCTKVSPGCANCYAATFSKRTGHQVWGANAPRRFFAEPHWKEPLKWDRLAGEAGERHRVFCGSMMDIGEDRPDLVEPRKRICDLVERTPNLDWLLLSKRPENFTRLMTWGEGRWPRNAWAMTTVENQKMADTRIPELLKVKTVVRGLSMEPLLEAVNIDSFHGFLGFVPSQKGCCHVCHEWKPNVRMWADGAAVGRALCETCDDGQRHWVIVGGESGPGARPFNLEWARSIVGQCKAAGVACFVKQMGSRPVYPVPGMEATREVNQEFMGSGWAYPKYRDPKGGDMAEWSEDLRVREMPGVAHA